ncbi:MAG: hypothetical protein IT363_11290 [Methanoregulaceae archaeon]|nr:hypothetical protein [Methanoregulaceae archaeon]
MTDPPSPSLFIVERFLRQVEPFWRPHPGQREFLLSPAKTKVLACGRRWGKTEVCAVEIVAALHADHPTQHLILAPTQDQAALLFDRVIGWLERLEIDHVVRRTPHPRVHVGPHTIRARSGHVGRSLRGQEATHLVIDEAAFIPEALITEVALPMLATTDGRCTMISTPHGRNHFWRFFRFGQEGQHGVWSRTAPSAQSPYVSASFLAFQRELISDRAYRVEYEAEFLDGAGCVFRSELVEACLVPRWDAEPRGAVRIGVDWGRYQDATAVAVVVGSRENPALVELHATGDAPWSEQVRWVAEIVDRYPGSIVTCDATGVGDPLVEALRAATRHATLRPFVFTGTSKPGLIDQLVWLIDNGRLKMTPFPDLLREMQHFQMTLSETGHPRLAASAGFHDDRICALALAVSELPSSLSPGIRTAGSRPFSFAKEYPR